ncbi:MAG TPA: tRNA (adenosine(37)-N6)-threonylcarbamoyltransferase complex dimerization subunit type 1 TsaB [Gemmatimonadales bacterium]|nr:tRNA (adenosine(37)-N6)-threonylcarbamoyltransferase complex dimerization subunit type 1 TsaB [Gemmatimonadales bacterium]
MSVTILAIDTATDIASVAVGDGSGVGSGAHQQGARRHAAEIVRLIDFALSRAGAHVADLDTVVVGDGPGSFTGLRIGWAAAKGLVQESGADVIAVPSLLAAAAGAAERVGSVPVAACFDALRGQVYAAVYVVHADRVDTLVPPTLTTITELAQRSTDGRPALAVGDGAVRYGDEVIQWTGVPPVPLDQLPPTAVVMLALAGRPGVGRRIEDFATAEPEYGRPAEAQAKWEAAHGRPVPRSTD